MELVKDRATREPDVATTNGVMAAAHKHGLVLIKAGMYDNVIRALVPLAITDEQLQEALQILDTAFAEVAQAVPSAVQ
jgi:4-aminobutyrate aminotransferase / (S)-3-amino-2-methylpropionate transaminase / 5-aminovalerate transaminase